MAIRIDEEFKSLIPPLTGEEYAGLEESILREGCRDALVLWGDTLIDGHNRFEICTRHGIPFQTVQKDFADRNNAKLWMMRNQLARRNLNDFQRIEITHKCEDAVKAKARERMEEGRNQYTDSPKEKFPEGKQARDELGAMAGVSGKTYEHAVKVLNTASQETLDALRRGEMSINQAYNTIRLSEKKEQILEAERAIHEQADEAQKPVLNIGDGIGFVPDEKYDLLLTDPPYSTEVDDIDTFADSWLYNALDNVKDTGMAYVFIGAYPDEIRAYLNARIPEHMALTQVLVWEYKNTLGQNPKDRYKQNYQACLFYRGINAPALDCPLTAEQWAVQEINAPDGRQGDRYHAWQKPMEIAERFVRHSTRPGDVVFDPFACTGTFLLAAAKLGRVAYGYEINPENAEIAYNRGCVHGVGR
jgi:DNA modification methylase